ncbi:MAG: DUF177 domain-containing protein [Candidatus Korobacteraceae bacterium]
MLLSLQELEKRPIDFHEVLPPESLDLGPDFRQVSSLESSGRATLLEEHHGHNDVIRDIRVVGELATSVEVGCARCLEPVSRNVQKAFDLLYRPLGIDGEHGEISVTQAEADIGYYRGEGLLLEDVLREQILLAFPIRVVCRDECQGLCPRCGRNLNDETCGCAETIVDPRWDALKKLRDEF